jgi:hypothetical protein
MVAATTKAGDHAYIEDNKICLRHFECPLHHYFVKLAVIVSVKLLAKTNSSASTQRMLPVSFLCKEQQQ